MPRLDNPADEKPGIDPILQKVLDAVPFRLSTEDGIDAARQRFRDLPRRPLHPELRVEDRTIPGPQGAIAVRIYWPPIHSESRPAPVVLYFHGGGFVIGDLDTHDGTARQHAVGAGAIVVSVDYRLAPNTPTQPRSKMLGPQRFGRPRTRPGCTATRAGSPWPGIRPAAPLAAVTAQRARDRGGPPVRFQLLWYPSTMWDASLPSFAENATAPILDVKAVAEFSRWYAGDVDLSDPPADMAPGRATDLSNLPPAYIGVAGYDPLRDDGIRYGERLAAAGVAAQVHNAETLVHGYLGYAGVVPAATAAMERGLVALRTALQG